MKNNVTKVARCATVKALIRCEARMIGCLVTRGCASWFNSAQLPRLLLTLQAKIGDIELELLLRSLCSVCNWGFA
jgi:hypothetical protein